MTIQSCKLHKQISDQYLVNRLTCTLLMVFLDDNKLLKLTIDGGKLFQISATRSVNKNSLGDEIANVNFLRRYGTYVLQNTKKENLLRLTN